MRFDITQFTLLFFVVVTAVAAANCGDDKSCLVLYGTEITKALVQQYDPLDTEATNYATQEPEEKPLNINFPTQTQNQTPEAVPNKHAQKRTDSSTPGTQIMSPWRQVVGGIAVAVLVAVV